MSTPEQKKIKHRVKREFFPVRSGVCCKCPYCSAEFAWPPEKLKCPSCHKTVRPPYGYGLPGKEERMKQIDKIKREGEKTKKDLGFRFKAGPRPGQALAVVAILAFVIVGPVLVVSSMKGDSNEFEANRKEDDPYEVTTNRMAVYAMAVQHFKEDTGRYPMYYGDGGLQALVSNPNLFHWYGPYINRISRDGWKRPFHYDLTNGVPLLQSAGPDRRFATDDDIIAPQSAYVVHPDFIRRNPARRATAKVKDASPAE